MCRSAISATAMASAVLVALASVSSPAQVAPELVATIVKKLTAGGRIFVQTDIEFLGEEMFELFRADRALSETAIDENPFPVKTEREKAVEDKDLPVFRRLFTKVG